MLQPWNLNELPLGEAGQMSEPGHLWVAHSDLLPTTTWASQSTCLILREKQTTRSSH